MKMAGNNKGMVMIHLRLHYRKTRCTMGLLKDSSERSIITSVNIKCQCCES